MTSLVKEPTVSTPKIYFDTVERIFEISGKSRPEHVNDFYEPILFWMDSYIAELALSGEKIHLPLKLHFSYLNSSSEKTLLRVVKKLQDFIRAGHTAEVIWCSYEEDEDVRDVGVDFSELSQVPFTFLSVE